MMTTGRKLIKIAMEYPPSQEAGDINTMHKLTRDIRLPHDVSGNSATSLDGGFDMKALNKAKKYLKNKKTKKAKSLQLRRHNENIADDIRKARQAERAANDSYKQNLMTPEKRKNLAREMRIKKEQALKETTRAESIAKALEDAKKKLNSPTSKSPEFGVKSKVALGLGALGLIGGAGYAYSRKGESKSQH